MLTKKILQFCKPLLIPYGLFFFVQLLVKIDPYLVMNNGGEMLLNLLYFIILIFGFFGLFFYIGAIYFPVHVASYYLRMAKIEKFPRAIPQAIINTYLCLSFFYIPLFWMYKYFCPTTTCDTAEPASFVALLIFSYVVNLISISIRGIFEVVRIRSAKTA